MRHCLDDLHLAIILPITLMRGAALTAITNLIILEYHIILELEFGRNWNQTPLSVYFTLQK